MGNPFCYIAVCSMVRFSAKKERMNSCIPPLLLGSTRSVSGSPRCHSAIVDLAYILQRNPTCLRLCFKRLTMRTLPFPLSAVL